MNYIIKGDISGIQDFIFNVQSKGAAKSLRARSFFIDALGLLAETHILNRFGLNKNARIFNGGGNFYLKIPEKKWDKQIFEDILNYFLTPFHNTQLSINLSYIEYDGQDYGKAIFDLNRKVNVQKLSKFKNAGFLFTPFEKTDHLAQQKFINFSSNLVRNNFYEIKPNPNSLPYPDMVKHDKIIAFGYELQLMNNPSSSSNRIFSSVPVWNEEMKKKYQHLFDKETLEGIKPGNVLEFEHLAEIAKSRTGSAKIAALKLDIDNLGSLFRQIQDEQQNRLLSEKISEFFTNNFFNIIQKESFSYQVHQKDQNGNKIYSVKTLTISNKEKKYKEYQLKTLQEPFKENLYVVFAGGDDSYIIGAWDAILAFALRLKEAFDEYEENEIRKQLSALQHPITFSAAIVITDDHFPIIKMSETAEDRLHQAKTIIESVPDASGKFMKNKVSFLNHIFSWDEFKQVNELKNIFLKMILKYGEERAFLHKLQDLFEGKEKKYWNLHNKSFSPRVLWLFKHIFRDIKNEPYFIASGLYDKFFDNKGIYNEYVWEKFTDNRQKGLPVPVAAKWTELTTKKS